MKISDAVKLNSAYSFFRAEAKNPTYSYLIASPDAITNELTAKSFVSFLTGKSEVDELKDVYFLPFGEKMLTSDSDFITETAYLMPTELEKKYFIVRYAESANEAAQNKLLKTLEEPPSTSVIILLCTNEYAMLPTVKSRCRIVRPSAYPDEVLYDVLSDEYPSCDNPSFVVAVANGSLDKLIFAAENGTTEFDRAIKILTCMRKSSDILPFATELIARKDKLGELLDAFEIIFRDCMAYPFGVSRIKLKGNVMDIREISALYTPEVVLQEMPVLMRAKRRLSGGGNINSIVDELLFSILEEKAKCQK